MASVIAQKNVFAALLDEAMLELAHADVPLVTQLDKTRDTCLAPYKHIAAAARQSDLERGFVRPQEAAHLYEIKAAQREKIGIDPVRWTVCYAAR